MKAEKQIRERIAFLRNQNNNWIAKRDDMKKVDAVAHKVMIDKLNIQICANCDIMANLAWVVGDV